MGFPRGSVLKNPSANARDVGSISGSGRSPGEGNGNPLQYFCLGIPWTEEPRGLESTGSQKSQTRLGNYNNDGNKITKHIKPRHTNSKFIDKFKI